MRRITAVAVIDQLVFEAPAALASMREQVFEFHQPLQMRALAYHFALSTPALPDD